MKDDYTIISYHGHDIKVHEYDEHVYLETTLHQMGESVNIGQCYNIKRGDYTPNEYRAELEKLMDRFLNFYEGLK